MFGRKSEFYGFMVSLAYKHNQLFKGATEPRCTRVVTNDMTSNYYFEYKGVETYVDQLTLQEHFDDDSIVDEDGEYANTYAVATLDEKAEALNELARCQYEELQA